jgi:hypothetical protein
MAKSTLGSLFGLALAVAGTPASAQPDSIVGSWVVIPSALNRPLGLPNVFTFTSDGTITRLAQPTAERPGHGLTQGAAP